MKKHLLTLCLALSANCAIWSQQYWSKRYDFEMGNEYGSQIIVRDDGFLVFMWSGCDIDNQDFCYSIIKFDLEGEKKWQAIMYDTIGPNALRAMAVRNDTIFVNTDYKTKDGYSILAYDIQGNYLDRFDYWHPGTQGSLWARTIKSRGGRMFVNFGYRDSVENLAKEKTRAYDQAWNQLWEVKVPDTPAYPLLNNVDMDACPDGGVVVACVSRKPSYETVCRIIKYNANGNKEWVTQLDGEYKTFSVPVTINIHPDGGYMGHWTLRTGSGFTNPDPDCWFKLDANGQIEWQKIVDPYETRNFTSTFIAQNGDMIGCGFGQDSPYDTIQQANKFYAYLSRIKSNGEQRWERRIFEIKEGGYVPLLYHGAEMGNGDLVFTGDMWDTIQTPQNPSYDDLWLLKLDSNGCVTPGCGNEQYLLPTAEPLRETELDAFTVFPNPFEQQFTLAGILGKHIPSGKYKAVLYDILGSEIFRKDFNPNLLTYMESGAIPSGTYTLVIFQNGRKVQALQIIKK